MYILGAILAVFSVIGLLRSLAIQVGWLKGPLLRPFETYSEQIGLHNSLRDLALWLALTLLGSLVAFSDFARLPSIVVVPVAGLLVVAWLAHESEIWIHNNLPFLMPLPHWYSDLIRRTMPDERRRIAYMWLRLPPRTRLHLSTHDSAFATWVDLVILATVG